MSILQMQTPPQKRGRLLLLSDIIQIRFLLSIPRTSKAARICYFQLYGNWRVYTYVERQGIEAQLAKLAGRGETTARARCGSRSQQKLSAWTPLLHGRGHDRVNPKAIWRLQPDEGRAV